MKGKSEAIIPIIRFIIANDDVDSPKGQHIRWKIGYSVNMLTPKSERLFVWQVGHIDDAKAIIEYFVKLGVREVIYDSNGALRIEWVFLFHDPS